MEETGLVLRPILGLGVVAVLAAALIGLSAVAYGRTTRPVSTSFKLLLLALRVGALAAAVAALLRPSLQTTHHELVKRPLLVLVDRSRSMSEICDLPGGLSRLEGVTRMLERSRDSIEVLEELYDVSVLGFARDLFVRGAVEDEAATRYSAYGAALEQAFEGLAGGQADAVVLIGDGAHNLGPPDPLEVAGALNEQGVPVYTIGVGEEQDPAALRDVRLLDVTAPRSAFVFARFPVRAQVLLRGCQGVAVEVQLQFAGQPAQSRTVTAAHAEEVVPLEFEAVPEEVGEQKLTVHAVPVAKEVLETNNTFTTYVRVVSDGVRVGLFDTLRPESKFIARSLTGAEHVVLRRVLVLPGRSPAADQFLPARYDVVMLGDLGPAALLPSRLMALKKAVQKDGKGLVVLFAQGDMPGRAFAHTAMEDLLPIRLGAGLRASERKSEFVAAEEHADHPVLALGPSREATLKAWAEMPPLAGAVIGAEPKRGATVLARDRDGNPLLVVHRAGAGRVACVMCDTTFRWFFTERDTQDGHRRFWRQLVLWAAGSGESDTQRLRLELSKQRLLTDEKLIITVRLTDESGAPVRDAALAVHVADPRGDRFEVPHAFSREAAAYVGECSPALQGDYTVTAQAERNGELLGRDRAHFFVSSPNIEVESPLPDLRLLRRIAAATQEAGGRYCYYTRADELFEGLRKKGAPLKLTTRQRTDVWDSWPLFAIFGGCLALEWALRKWKGLL